jgi:hypothetical protein
VSLPGTGPSGGDGRREVNVNTPLGHDAETLTAPAVAGPPSPTTDPIDFLSDPEVVRVVAAHDLAWDCATGNGPAPRPRVRPVAV